MLYLYAPATVSPNMHYQLSDGKQLQVLLTTDPGLLSRPRLVHRARGGPRGRRRRQQIPGMPTPPPSPRLPGGSGLQGFGSPRSRHGAGSDTQLYPVIATNLADVSLWPIIFFHTYQTPQPIARVPIKKARWAHFQPKPHQTKSLWLMAMNTPSTRCGK